jgi:hypothetical protein
MNQKNGKSAAPPQTPFQALAQMILGLGAARTKQEAMARLAACQKLLHGIEQAFGIQSQKMGHLQNVLLAMTEGEFRHLSLNIEGDVEGYVFTDSEGKPVWVVDASRGMVLITPEHVEPIVVTVKMKDGTEKKIEINHLGNEEEGAEPPADHERLRVPVGEVATSGPIETDPAGLPADLDGANQADEETG